MLSYLDGASVSMIAAAFASGFAGLAVLTRMYWHRILGVFSKKHKARADEARAELVTSDSAPES